MPVGVWTLHPRKCADCEHRWHGISKCRKNLSLKMWQPRRECNCTKAERFTIKKAMEYVRSLQTFRGTGN